MTLEEFRTQILTKEELEQFSEKEVEQLYAISVHFANLSFKNYVEQKLNNNNEK